MATEAKRKSGAMVFYGTREKAVEATSKVAISDSATSKGRPGIVKFGSVVIKGGSLGSQELRQNVEFGQTALRKVKAKLVKPGVSLGVTRGVPLYHADPQRPDWVVRVLDGKSERGVFVNGVFKPL